MLNYAPATHLSNLDLSRNHRTAVLSIKALNCRHTTHRQYEILEQSPNFFSSKIGASFDTVYRNPSLIDHQLHNYNPFDTQGIYDKRIYSTIGGLSGPRVPVVSEPTTNVVGFTNVDRRRAVKALQRDSIKTATGRRRGEYDLAIVV
ncbi:hypothetical protein ACVIIV_004454 [Bradyrhizobium sp. USDA 4354]